MKSLFSFAAILVVLFLCQASVSSCAKTNTVIKTDTLIVLVQDSSVAGRLIAKEWIVDSLFHGYTSADPTNLGTLIYKRGASNNQQNLDDYIETYWWGGTQYLYNGANVAGFSYHFLSTDSLNLVINNPQPDTARLVTLTQTHMTTYDSTNSAISFYSIKPR